MRELYFYVEGQSEQGYLSKVLTPHLAGFNVHVRGAIRLKKPTYGSLRHHLGILLKQHRRPGVRFTTLFDLYALPSDFLGCDEALRIRHIPDQRARTIEEAWAADVNDPRFIPHVQLYEFETILLCEPEAFCYFYEDCDAQVAALRELVEKEGPPERINDRYETVPSRRIDGIFPGYVSAKTTAGVDIASCISLETVRCQCPHFHTWLSRLEALDQESLPGD